MIHTTNAHAKLQTFVNTHMRERTHSHTEFVSLCALVDLWLSFYIFGCQKEHGMQDIVGSQEQRKKHLIRESKMWISEKDKRYPPWVRESSGLHPFISSLHIHHILKWFSF